MKLKKKCTGDGGRGEEGRTHPWLAPTSICQWIGHLSTMVNRYKVEDGCLHVKNPLSHKQN